MGEEREQPRLKCRRPNQFQRKLGRDIERNDVVLLGAEGRSLEGKPQIKRQNITYFQPIRRSELD